MKLYVNFFGLTLPSYGLMIVLGVVLANLVALWVVKKKKHDMLDFIVLEAYTFLGAFIGAKLLYFIVSYKEIDWSRITDLNYFNQIMQGGFVFYGGFIGGVIVVLVAGKVHKLDALQFIQSYIFLIPFIHCFGRIGCFMAGCCYGKPYHGPGAVTFPEGSLALTGVSLFPIQLVEALSVLLIAIIILFLQMKKNWNYTVETYLITYGIVRFVLEYYRYDEARGAIGGLYTSQWISIVLIFGAAMSYFVRQRNSKKVGKK